MKTRFLLIAAAAVLLAGCTDEALVETPQSGDPSGKPEFVVGIGADLKTVLGDDGTTTHKVYWSDGDKIVINDVRSEALSGIGSDVQSTTFTMESSVSAPYNVVYFEDEIYNARHQRKNFKCFNPVHNNQAKITIFSISVTPVAA